MEGFIDGLLFRPPKGFKLLDIIRCKTFMQIHTRLSEQRSNQHKKRHVNQSADQGFQSTKIDDSLSLQNLNIFNDHEGVLIIDKKYENKCKIKNLVEYTSCLEIVRLAGDQFLLEILRIDQISIQSYNHRDVYLKTNFCLRMRVAHNGCPPMCSHCRAQMRSGLVIYKISVVR